MLSTNNHTQHSHKIEKCKHKPVSGDAKTAPSMCHHRHRCCCHWSGPTVATWPNQTLPSCAPNGVPIRPRTVRQAFPCCTSSRVFICFGTMLLWRGFYAPKSTPHRNDDRNRRWRRRRSPHNARRWHATRNADRRRRQCTHCGVFRRRVLGTGAKYKASRARTTHAHYTQHFAQYIFSLLNARMRACVSRCRCCV